MGFWPTESAVVETPAKLALVALTAPLTASVVLFRFATFVPATVKLMAEALAVTFVVPLMISFGAPIDESPSVVDVIELFWALTAP